MCGERFAREGFCVAENAIDESTLGELTAALDSIAPAKEANRRRESVYGVRHLLQISPVVRSFSESATVRRLAESFLGPRARIVRAIFFDKTPAANWKVPWHQDLTIAVRERKAAEGFAPWTRKAGVWHVQPPVEILEKMTTLRFHLDDADETNGALRVVPGTHRAGRLSAVEIKSAREANKSRLASVKRGDCLIMRPLILHASSAGTAPRRRRVVHFELAADELPNGLNWYDS